MRRGTYGVLSAASLILVVMLVHAAPPGEAPAAASPSGESATATFQDDIYVKPRGGIGMATTLEWFCHGTPCVAGRPGELRDDLRGAITHFESSGEALNTLKFKVSGIKITLTRDEDSFDWSVRPFWKRFKTCVHGGPNKTCKDDGIPPELMGTLDSGITIRTQRRNVDEMLPAGGEVHLKGQ